ncbi:hypothetical protein C5167_010369 [Papaver somniferum]|uniref:Uncharacterized protein n=1 Tax=Papaver somniferum TaxID=3469 RepID=A0A4Y7K408_PAPSO|nr:hypothetical protein C5167_010369 [Papaver somniferum]
MKEKILTWWRFLYDIVIRFGGLNS